MFSQATDSIWMVKPARFYSNPETASTNAFQQLNEIADNGRIALKEFDEAVVALRNAGIQVFVSENNDPEAPDAIFPNNWISFHQDGTVVLYPMMAESRRRERKLGIPSIVKDQFLVQRIIDLSTREASQQFLEGTGSIVFDHINRYAYAVRSERTNAALLNEICVELKYTPVLFSAVDQSSFPVYHTNVVMSIGSKFAVICLDAITDAAEKLSVTTHLENSGKLVIPITLEQMHLFAGNMLEVINNRKENILVLSETAISSLESSQKELLEQYVSLLPLKVPIIERLGGGSIRCMICEIFLPIK